MVRAAPRHGSFAGTRWPWWPGCSVFGIGFAERDRKSRRLNSSHRCISYAVFCLKKKGTIGTPGIFVTNSALASTLYFSDNGEYFPTGPSYYGGQGVWGKYVAPSYKLAADHAYASVDVTNSYDYNYNPTQRSLRYFY